MWRLNATCIQQTRTTTRANVFKHKSSQVYMSWNPFKINCCFFFPTFLWIKSSNIFWDQFPLNGYRDSFYFSPLLLNVLKPFVWKCVEMLSTHALSILLKERLWMSAAVRRSLNQTKSQPHCLQLWRSSFCSMLLPTVFVLRLMQPVLWFPEKKKMAPLRLNTGEELLCAQCEKVKQTKWSWHRHAESHGSAIVAQIHA